MRYTAIQKSPTGYVLRHSRTVKLMSLIPCAFIGIIPTVLVISLFFTEGVDPDNLLPTALGTVLMWSITVYLFSLAFGFRIVVDETGIHRCSFRRVKQTLLWRYVRSFGIGVIRIPNGRPSNHLAFYASTEAKPIDYKSMVFIKLSPADEQAIRESGIIVFCRRQMDRADRKFR